VCSARCPQSFGAVWNNKYSVWDNKSRAAIGQPAEVVAAILHTGEAAVATIDVCVHYLHRDGC